MSRFLFRFGTPIRLTALDFANLEIFVSSYRILVYRSGQLAETRTLDHPIEVGRRDVAKNEPRAIAFASLAGKTKLIVADETETEIARCWFRVSADSKGQVVIENLHDKIRIPISNGDLLGSGETRAFDDVLINLGRNLALRAEAVSSSAPESDEFRSLRTSPPSPGDENLIAPTIAIRQLAAPDAQEVAKMLRLALQVVHKAAGSDAFFQAAALAAAQIVELDRAAVLVHNPPRDAADAGSPARTIDQWSTVAEHVRDGVRPGGLQTISRTVLQRVVETASTVIHDPGKRRTGGDSEDPLAAPSLMSVCCAAAAPILDRDRRVVGVLYGDRRSDQFDSSKNGISDLEATLMEIVAGSVAGGIARQFEERLRSTLSEFFSPKVANLLANQPELMEGQDAEVTVLFCDVRGFSAVTEKLGPRKAIEWINDVMSELSQCVIDRDGVLVDYVGDELLAMWGSPGVQADHASRAFDAARAMMTAIETLRVRWADVLPQRFGAGIGINTGAARVGNVGSRQKFKYGALGNTVNSGSRLQSATKQIGVTCMASGETIRAAGKVDQCRRLAQLSVVGIEQAIHVYQVVQALDDSWMHLKQNYELALEDYESQRFGEAARRLGELVQTHPEDRPCKRLLSRAVQELDEPSADFSPVWNLTSK